jgi:hypothetical protein
MKKDRQPSAGVEDLVTPTIKSDKYTTGRGGQGNIAKNDPNHPEVARASQDIIVPAPREHDAAFHVGRGGAANFAKPTEAEAEAARKVNNRRSRDAERLLAEDKERSLKDKVLDKVGIHHGVKN